MSVAGCGLLALACYRYYTLSGKSAMFDSKYSILLLFVISALYPTPTMVAQRIASFGQNIEGLLEVIQKKAPEYTFLVEQGFCCGFKNPTLSLIYMVCCGIQVSMIAFVGLLYAVKTIRLLEGLKHSLSPSAYAAQKQLVRSVCIQFMIPSITLVAPVCIVIFTALMRLPNTNSRSNKF